MFLRYLWIEAIELLARPLHWLGIVVVSIVVLAGLDELALDQNIVRVLIIDNDDTQSQGLRVKALVGELSGVESVLRRAPTNLDAVIDETKADIIILKLSDTWQASLRPRSILDHRRLARIGFGLAAIINHLTPWETVISADSVSRMDYGRTACEIGERVCSTLKAVGDTQFKALCSLPSSYTPATAYPFDDKTVIPCQNSRGTVLNDALGFDFRLKKFCDPTLVDSERSVGLCTVPDAPTLGSVVSLFGSPQSHTRVFIPRTICLLSVFVAFVVCCRSLMQETRNNTWPVILAITHGDARRLIVAKLVVTVSFVLVLVIGLLEFSNIQFDIAIKPGLIPNLLPIALGALSSAMLGLVVALVVRNEVSAYAIASFYFLILFVLSGYIDDLKDSNSVLSVFSYVLPLRFIIAPFSSWMTFGVSVPLQESITPLLSQSLGSLALLLCAALYRQRSS
jgi:hypothetical protein